jgi:hypothetical protein
MGEQVVLPWHAVRAILLARDISFSALVPELQRFGNVPADDQNLTVIATAR